MPVPRATCRRTGNSVQGLDGQPGTAIEEKVNPSPYTVVSTRPCGDDTVGVDKGYTAPYGR